MVRRAAHVAAAEWSQRGMSAKLGDAWIGAHAVARPAGQKGSDRPTFGLPLGVQGARGESGLSALLQAPGSHRISDGRRCRPRR
jgi:hypothetical protein